MSLVSIKHQWEGQDATAGWGRGKGFSDAMGKVLQDGRSRELFGTIDNAKNKIQDLAED